MTPSVVSFDLDGTLWDFLPMMEGALAQAVEELERRHPDLAGRLTVPALHQFREQAAAQLSGTLDQVRRLSLRLAFESLGRGNDPELLDWMSETLMQARADRVLVHGDVLPELDRLGADGYVVGAITNGNFPFERLKLARRFAFVVHAEHVGAAKPAAEPFAAAVRVSGGDPRRWVHVGDDPEIDVAGARAFGMRAVWINREGRTSPSGVTADAELPSMAGLAGVVRWLLPGA